MNKRFTLIFGTLLVLVAGFILWSISHPPASQPKATIVLAGFTNDLTGVPYAMVSVSNHSPTSLQLLSSYDIQIPTANRWTNASRGFLSSGTTVLKPDESVMVLVAAPTNYTSWRVSLAIAPDVGLVQDLLNHAKWAAWEVGLTRRHPRGSVRVFSDRISE